MKIKFMNYNILTGFHNSDDVFQPERLEAAQRIVESQKPDILAITEASFGGPNSFGIHMDYKKIFGFKYAFFAGHPYFGKRKGDEGGNCLLSNIPFEAEKIVLDHKSAVRARISLEDKMLTIDVVHTSPSENDIIKMMRIKPLLLSKQEPYIITGDFNTVSHEDFYNRENAIKELKSYCGNKAEELVDDLLEGKLVRELFSFGLRDAIEDRKARVSTVPTSILYGPRVGMRMDHFFISRGVQVSKAFVLKNEDTEIASDHYPIIAYFEV